MGLELSETSNSPLPPRTFSWEDAVDDLQEYALRTQRENHLFAQATESRHEALLSSSQSSYPSLLDRRRRTSLAQVSSSSPLLDASCSDSMSNKTIRYHTEPADAELAQQCEAYAKRMAENALTRNGRALKARATTNVSRRNVTCYGSAYTRPCAEVLREVVRSRYPAANVESLRLPGDRHGTEGEALLHEPA